MVHIVRALFVPRMRRDLRLKACPCTSLLYNFFLHLLERHCRFGSRVYIFVTREEKSDQFDQLPGGFFPPTHAVGATGQNTKHHPLSHTQDVVLGNYLRYEHREARNGRKIDVLSVSAAQRLDRVWTISWDHFGVVSLSTTRISSSHVCYVLYICDDAPGIVSRCASSLVLSMGRAFGR